jgi:hypothetical protein
VFSWRRALCSLSRVRGKGWGEEAYPLDSDLLVRLPPGISIAHSSVAWGRERGPMAGCHALTYGFGYENDAFGSS